MRNRTKRRAEQRRNANINRQAEAVAAKPTSEAQIAANRENAKYSTGPSSESGKAAVSQNRHVHGLNYNPSTFLVLACEDQAEYDRFLRTLLDEQAPTGAVENLLVVSMAQHRWLLDRATRLQETCFDQETGQIDNQKLFSLYLRYATAHERAFHKCLNDLLKLRTIRQKLAIGFESQKRQSERHECAVRAQELDYRLRQVKVLEAEDAVRRAKTSGEREKADQKAA